MAKRLDPAKTVVEVCGGTSKLAAALGLHRTAVHNWMQPKDNNGTGGFIPSWHQPEVLAYAEQNGIPLTAEMLILGSKSREKRGRK